MKYIPLIILSMFLSGCAHFENSKVIPDAVVKVSPAVLELCANLNENITVNTFDDAILAYADLSTMYGVCANKQVVSVKLLKQFANIGDKK